MGFLTLEDINKVGETEKERKSGQTEAERLHTWIQKNNIMHF